MGIKGSVKSYFLKPKIKDLLRIQKIPTIILYTPHDNPPDIVHLILGFL